MSAVLRALPVALLVLATQLPAPSPAVPAAWGPGFQPGFHWDQLAPQYWQPQAKVLTAGLDLGRHEA